MTLFLTNKYLKICDRLTRLMALSISITGVFAILLLAGKSYAQAPAIRYPSGTQTLPLGVNMVPISATNAGGAPYAAGQVSLFSTGFADPIDIAADAGDTHDIEIRRGQKGNEGDRVVTAGIAIDDRFECHVRASINRWR